ncbi:dihydrofolate reductase [Sphingomonas sp.]|uniref:dihydrofolate reductase n=1 Tax=Sphingomonas sp. TaxID=28214 RepID=UPI002DD6A58A|nr:dihydrofolate reductase [Sphingomonas sp.]
MTSIVAVAREGAIGAGNRLPWRVKSDMTFFRSTTSGNVVIMGRRTRDSLGGCLPNRENIVVTHGFALFPETATCRSSGSIPEALALADKLARSRKDIYVIGGAMMYGQFAPYVDRYLVTYIDKSVPDADTFFNPIDVNNNELWIRKVLHEGVANSAGDEADYKIVEYVARDSSRIKDLRARTIETFREPSRRRLEHSTLSGISLVA